MGWSLQCYGKLSEKDQTWGTKNVMIEFIIQNLPKVGDELLQCAMANCDSIEALKMFRGHCKPIWLFIVSGNSQNLSKSFCQ